MILFVYVVWRKICTVMSFSCSLKMFAWRQNSSRSGYFVSWGKIGTVWVMQKYRHRISAMKNIGISIGPKKTHQSSSSVHIGIRKHNGFTHQCSIDTAQIVLSNNGKPWKCTHMGNQDVSLSEMQWNHVEELEKLQASFSSDKKIQRSQTWNVLKNGKG